MDKALTLARFDHMVRVFTARPTFDNAQTLAGIIWQVHREHRRTRSQPLAGHQAKHGGP